MYKLVAIDLDGTLLNSEKRISEVNKEAVHYVKRKGMKVVICSGRIFAGARVFAGQLGIKDPIISCNGAVIKDMETGELLYSNTVETNDCLKVIDICRDEDIYFHVYIGDTMYTERLAYSSLFYYKRNLELPEKDRVDIQLVDSTARIVSNSSEASKIVVVSDDSERLIKARKRIEEIGTLEVASSSFDNFEVMNQGVNKGMALEFLCNRLGFDRSEVIAIGDNENDYSMIKFAGLGVAMGNAEESIKEIANEITLTNDRNGVAEILRKYA